MDESNASRSHPEKIGPSAPPRVVINPMPPITVPNTCGCTMERATTPSSAESAPIVMPAHTTYMIAKAMLPLPSKNSAETPSAYRATIIKRGAVNLLIAESRGIRPASCMSPRMLASRAAVAVVIPAAVMVGT